MKKNQDNLNFHISFTILKPQILNMKNSILRKTVGNQNHCNLNSKKGVPFAKKKEKKVMLCPLLSQEQLKQQVESSYSGLNLGRFNQSYFTDHIQTNAKVYS